MRLEKGGLIDRGRPHGFTFDGRRLTGCAGDTLASALPANGVRRVGRGPRYRRPRGIVTAGAEEPGALAAIVDPDGRVTADIPATVQESFEGLRARSRSRRASRKGDATMPGAAASGADDGRYETAFAFCDIMVIGAGPAGLSPAPPCAASLRCWLARAPKRWRSG